MQQLDQVIQQNASASEEMSTGSDALSDQAETLQISISFFKLSEKREQSRRPASARRGAFTQKSSSSRQALTAKARPTNAGGFDIEIGSDHQGGDPQDKDFTTFQ